jgi:outer membrane protein assembly factor BamD
MIRRLAIVLLCVAAAAACGRVKTVLPAAGSVDADKYLFDHGSDALKKRHWLVAREYFKKLVDTYPQSSYRQEAKLGIGDTYLGENSLESNILAANEFREFLSFFPGNERTDYAQYKIAVAYSHQMLGPERDPTPAQDALGACETFLRNYPTSSLRPEVEKVRRQARDTVSGHDYKVGVYYYRVRWFPGAVDRFRKLLDADPEYSQRDAVYYFLAEIYHSSKQDAEALPFYDRVVKEFQKSDYLEKAKKRLVELKPTTDGK